MANNIIGLVFFFLLWFGCPIWGLPPLLNVSSEFVVDTQTYGNFAIRCEGTEELLWNWTGTFMASEMGEVYNITEEKHTNVDRPFISTITVYETLTGDTGFFYCHYDGATNFATDDQNVARTYAYVYEGDQGLLESKNQHIRKTTADKLVLDCRTNLPNVPVTLEKDGTEISPRKALWNPKIGFVIHNLAIQDSGIYTCSVEDSDLESIFIVQISPSSPSISKPAIDWELSQHFVVGHSFKINCSVLIQNDVTFHWTVPNSNDSSKVENIPGAIIRGQSEYRVSTLLMHNATSKDSGIYKCEVSAQGKNPNEGTREIVVKDSLDPYINLTSSVSVIPGVEGKLLQWRAEIQAFPPDPVIVYRDWRDKEVQETDRVTTEHHISSAESWLRIQNITAEDFGNYTVVASLPHHSLNKSRTVLFEVKSKPYPSMYGVPEYIKEGEVLHAYCRTVGFPVAVVKWKFKPCPDGEQSCSDSSFDDLDAFTKLISKILPPGNIVNASLAIVPTESGLLRCEAQNEHGENSTTVPVPMSDIGGNVVFRLTYNNDSSSIKGNKKSIDIVVNDSDFNLMCGVTKFFYKDASMTLPRVGLDIIKNETKYSRQEHAYATKVTKSIAGKYICSAIPHEEDLQPSVKELFINVLDEERVAFVNANMQPRGNEVVMVENEPFYLNCTVSGTPKPTIEWFKDNEPLPADSAFFDEETVFLNDSHQRIYFKYVFQDNLGTYSCKAVNRLNIMIGYLTITAPSPGIGTGGKVGLVVAFLGIALLVIVVVYLIKRVKKERSFRKSFRQNELYLFEKGNIGQLNPDCTADEQAELLPYDPIWEVESNNIRIGKQLGAGAFGRVVKAIVTGLEDDQPETTVAVKMCKSQADQSQVRALALELKIMIHLGKHLNIVNLMGANTVHIGKGELLILVEYCRFGNLLSFMHKHRNKFINQIDPITGNIDFTKTTPDAISPFSPTSRTSGSRGYRTAPITDMDGYLAPTASKFNLSSPPVGRQTPSPPQSPTSNTGSTNGSYRSDGSAKQHADNPMYNMVLQRSVSENPEGDPAFRGNLSRSADVEAAIRNKRMNSITSLEANRKPRLDSIKSVHSDSFGKPRLNSNTYSDTGSVGYSREDTHITNTDMTILPSLNSHLSPLSPTDSSHLSDVGVDSKGNPFYMDAGIVPAVTAPFTTSDLVCWSWQVAQGMDYLSQRKVLHGDLAARNILLANDNVIKISDFGLSREMYKKDVYMKKGDDLMPIKWMAVEAIRDRIFSVQSDVWAYGVTLWELFTLGSTPYPSIEVNKDFLQLIEDGHRMDRPKFANKEIYEILLSCWESDPRGRPTFSEAAERLGVLMLPDLRGEYMHMNDPYMRMNEERFRTDTDYLGQLASPNFDNVHKDDEARLHYVNVGEVSDRDSNYLDMKSPNSVGYSRVGFNPNAHIMPENSEAPKPHYLPMSSTQGTPSPMVDVFSPRPNENPRFTFVPSMSERPPQLTELPEEEECASQTHSKEADDLAMERSSLINSASDNSSTEDVTSDNPLSSSKDRLQSDSALEADTENEPVLYVNIPTHGVDYANL